MCARQWRKPVNAEKTEEVVCFITRCKPNHKKLVSGGNEVVKRTEYKHLWMTLDDRLNFQSHINDSISKARRAIDLILCLCKYDSKHVLDQVYKLHKRPQLGYDDIVHHKNDPKMRLDFTRELEQVQ